MSSNIIWLLQKTHLYWCALEPYLSILMCCLLTHPHTHTHIVDHTALTSRSKETCQRCSATFVNNSLNTKLIQYIFQQREDKIAVFEVNSLIENRDAQMRIHATSISLSLSLSWFGSIWEKGLAISNYWGTCPPQCLRWLSPLSNMKICCGTIMHSYYAKPWSTLTWNSLFFSFYSTFITNRTRTQTR